MPPEVVARVFEPFYTTKPLGEGPGLSHSMIYGFEQQSGGQNRIHSGVGQGTTVRIFIPRHVDEALHDADDAKAMVLEPTHDGESVLVVDDKATVPMLVSDVLDELGYKVLEAADGAAGLKVLRSTGIDLLVTDVGLPGAMNGRQMADAARVSRPGFKTLFIIGYAETSVAGSGRLEAGMAVLTKRFAVDALATRGQDLMKA